MKKFAVNISDEALADMENIYSYIANELLSPYVAREQYVRIANAIMHLASFPERYTSTERISRPPI